MSIKAAIFGPTGYSGLELIRLLLRHPQAKIVYLGGRREERPHIADIWPALRGLLELRVEVMDPQSLPDDTDVVFTALPHGVSFQFVPGLLQRGFKVVDIGADYRLKDPALYRKWYGLEHADTESLARAVYGLTEFSRESIATAALVANPGCYPTSVLLASTPMLVSGLAAGGQVIADSKSGVSGAGRAPTEETHYPECNESISAYKIGTHRHSPEIEQAMRELSAGRPCSLLFAPHLAPMDRGILSTCYFKLACPQSTEELQRLYAEHYAGESFVRVRSGQSLPRTKDVLGTNYCDIAVRAVGEYAVAVAVIDNLVKGAAGQAIQNMNVMFGIDERMGLL